MLQSQLKNIQKKSQEGNATISDIIEIVSESFISQSNNFKEMKSHLKNMETMIIEVMETLEKTNAPVFQVIEDETE